MSTPTDPTHPQPKPADAAGLRWHNPDNLPSAGEPPWRFLVEGEGKNDEDEYWFTNGPVCQWVAVNPRRHLPNTNAETTYRTKRDLPTPHAAEAGVRAGDETPRTDEFISRTSCKGTKVTDDFSKKDLIGFARTLERELAVALQEDAVDFLADVAEWFKEQRTEQCRCHGDGETCDFCTHAASVERVRKQRTARHRTAAETVGTGEGSRALFEAVGLWLADRSRRGLMVQGELEENVIKAFKEYPATPPATQSALEALESLIREERVGNGVALMCCKGGVDIVALGDQDGSDLGESLGFAPTLAAALNAVLPPAKGGAQ